MGFGRQLLALLEKDVWIRKFKRNKFSTLMEFLFPVIIVGEHSLEKFVGLFVLKSGAVLPSEAITRTHIRNIIL